MAVNNTSEWAISADIYDIVGTIDNLKKKFIEDEDETTLALGIFGFIGDTEAKKIQTAVIMAGELGNEMFPQRAKLDKNVTTHAMYCNVDDMNANPSHIIINLAVRQEDLDVYMKDNKFIFDRTCPIYIGDYEFHFDYDIILSRTKNNQTGGWFYNAYYDMEEINNLSSVTNPYLKQPYTMNFNNYTYIFLQCVVKQISIETTIDKMITASVIDNKSYTFTFENQMADFDVYITENNETIRLKPLIYGTPVELGVTDYCWYLYMNDSSIRIGFDSESYLPGLNADIKIVAQTTSGAEGNFTFKYEDGSDEGFYVDFESAKYNYKKITCLVRPASDATEGTDKKTTEELKAIIPKMAMSRGYITTETDLNNYFNLISTEDNRLKLQKKVDNQLNRIWYCYLLMKDQYKNIIPTNTIPIKIDSISGYTIECLSDEGRFVLPAGTPFKYSTSLGYAVPIKESEIPDPFSENYFNITGIEDYVYYYRSPLNICINTNPLYTAFYMTIQNYDSYFEYNWVNPSMFMGFVVNTLHFERSLLSKKDEYRLTFSMQQSIAEDFSLYYELNSENITTIINNMKVFLVLYKDGVPYRYTEGVLTDFDQKSIYKSDWEISFKTDDQYDSDNHLRLIDLNEVGTGTPNYGFFEDNCHAEIYIYAKFGTEYGRYDADNIIPGMEDYTLVNIYNVADGIQLFNNFTSIMNNKIRMNLSEDNTVAHYDILGVPMVGEHFLISEDNVTYFIKELHKKKAYIDYCLSVLENNMQIDFKYFNTYGFSKTYHIGDSEQTTLGNIDITMKFRLKLINAGDTVTKQNIIEYIKAYIEDLNETDDLHIPNMLHDIKEEFNELIIYIEFMNFNDNRLGVNHIELRDIEDPSVVPEFISVRNRYNVDGTVLEPCIDIEIVT